MPQASTDSRPHLVDEGVAAGTLHLRPGTLVLLCGGWLALLALLVVIARQVPVTGPAQMSWPRATFFVLNAASLTGFDTTWAPAGMLPPVHAAVALLGMLATAMLSIFIATAAFVRVSGWDCDWRTLWRITGLFLASLVAAGFALELIGGGSIASAAWNACIVATAGGMIAGDTSTTAPLLWYGRFPIAFIAAIGPFVLLDTLRRRNGAGLTRVSRLTWSAVPISFVCASAVVVLASTLHLIPDASSPVAIQVLDSQRGTFTDLALPAATAAVDARGAGFTDAAAQLSHPARWALIPVLLMGGASGGVGGGIKAVTAAVLVLGLWRLLRGGRTGRTFAMAALLLAAFALLFGATFLVLVQVQPQLRPDRAAVLAAAACGSAGVSIDPVGATAADAYVLATAMLLGRALPWVFLWWSAARADEPVAIG